VATLDQRRHGSVHTFRLFIFLCRVDSLSWGHIFVREHPHKYVLNVSKPLYGLIDSGLYWFNTYTQAFQGIRTEPTAVIEILMYRAGNNLNGLNGIQVDDTLMSGARPSAQTRLRLHSQFDLSSAEDGPVLSYSGVEIYKDTALM
jgi:hypothetical protein